MSDRIRMCTEPPTGIEAGDRVLCPNGHHIATATKTMPLGSHINAWTDNFDYVIGKPALGTAVDELVCPECGRNWYIAC